MNDSAALAVVNDQVSSVAERIAGGVLDGARDGDLVDGAGVEVRVRVQGRRRARVADARRDVGAGPLLAQAEARAVDRRRVHRLAEADLDVGVGGDIGGVRGRIALEIVGGVVSAPPPPGV